MAADSFSLWTQMEKREGMSGTSWGGTEGGSTEQDEQDDNGILGSIRSGSKGDRLNATAELGGEHCFRVREGEGVTGSGGKGDDALRRTGRGETEAERRSARL